MQYESTIDNIFERTKRIITNKNEIINNYR